MDIISLGKTLEEMERYNKSREDTGGNGGI